MAIKKILQRAWLWADAVGHFGRLGRVAANRSFLKREKSKLTGRLGEKYLEQVRSGKDFSTELKHLVGQIEKIEDLLAKQDYGGKEGINFSLRERKRKKKIR